VNRVHQQHAAALQAYPPPGQEKEKKKWDNLAEEPPAASVKACFTGSASPIGPRPLKRRVVAGASARQPQPVEPFAAPAPSLVRPVAGVGMLNAVNLRTSRGERAREWCRAIERLGLPVFRCDAGSPVAAQR